MPGTNASRMGFTLWALLLLLSLNDASALSSEGCSLLRFRSGIKDDPSNALVNWSADDDNPCEWFGIHCENGTVTSIDLTGLSLQGILAPELGQLTSLRELILRENALMGVIPSQFGELQNLEVLDLAYNKLTGPLPQALGNLSSLKELYLENNSLEGAIPSDLGKLRSSHELNIVMIKSRDTISVASIKTSVPESNMCDSIFEIGLCCVKCLRTANFSGNYFVGELPTCLDHLPRFSFYHNCFSSEELQHQRSLEDCTKRSVGFMHRVLLQADGNAGVPSSTSTNSSNLTSFTISMEPSPAPSPTESSLVPSSDPEKSPAEPNNSPSPSPSQLLAGETRKSSTNIVLYVAVSISSVIFILVATLVFLCYRHKAAGASAAVRPWKSSMSGELEKEFVIGVPAISRTELEDACEGFSNIIGSVPNIVLFKGTFSNGKEIAVTSIRKSGKSWSTNSERIFWKKVESLSRMSHPNLVNLIGYCAEEDPFVRMLVFEYVPNGTVSEHLHNKEFEHLDWGTRMRIIMGVAYALEHMHNGSDSHTKVEAKAVYLTEDYSAKLADFGVWKASSRGYVKASSEQTNAFDSDDLELSDRLVPDLDSNISDFGIFLLEMVSGRPPFCKELGSVSEWAMDYLGPFGLVDRIIDPSLKAYKLEELKVIGSLALECLQEDTSIALTMKQITARLRSSLTSLDEPAVTKSSPLLWAELEILSQD